MAREAFARGLIIETCGSDRNVLKFLPPLVIDAATLALGLDRLRQALRDVVKREAGAPVARSA